MIETTSETPLWAPNACGIGATRMAGFVTHASELSGQPMESCAELHLWSVESPSQFWKAIWNYCEVEGLAAERVLVEGESMREARWFSITRPADG